jgi:transcriptional regulator with XRE-family HTH domain
MKHTPLKVYINSLCVDKGVSAARVIEKSGLDRMYGHQLFNGLRKKPSRDKIIQLAIGFEMDYEETQELLKTARKSALYPRIQRDSVIIFALKNGLSIDDVQSALEELALSPLGKDDD